MPIWRCPHCGVPQAESARCWVCHKSSASCLTCRHFRSSVVAQLGYCGLDPKRSPLNGDEIRPCWEARLTGPQSPIQIETRQAGDRAVVGGLFWSESER